jgi:two-component system, OmpR family, phosphate regulon sensor histidine kinase PhoR
MKIIRLFGSKYFLEFLLVFISFEVLFLLILGFNAKFLIESSVTLVLLLILLKILSKRRDVAISQIKNVITGINKNEFVSPKEIILDESLSDLQTEIRNMYKKMRSDIEYLKKLERVRTEFLANVSHELRTPIFTIQGYLETLLNGAISDDKVNLMFLNKAVRHTENLNHLLNDLIDISMIESGEMKMNFVHFKIGEYLESLFREFVPLAESRDLELKHNYIRGDLEVYGDKVKLKQVFANLIGNAIKYTEKGTIEVNVEERENSVRIIVKDTGIGLAEEDTTRIFERFYRTDKARSREMGGTGLGLAIAKHIVEAHGSRIKVRSELNVGTEFFFKLKK